MIWLLIVCGQKQQTAQLAKTETVKYFSNPIFQICSVTCWLIYLVSVCAWLELFELIVEHGELPSDALYPSVQTSVFAVLGVEIIFISLALLGRADHFILPGIDGGAQVLKERINKRAKIFPSISIFQFFHICNLVLKRKYLQ